MPQPRPLCARKGDVGADRVTDDQEPRLATPFLSASLELCNLTLEKSVHVLALSFEPVCGHRRLERR